MTFMPESSPVPGTARGARATGMLEFRDYLHMVRRYWVMVLVLTCLGVGAGVAATVLITPRYEATTELYVSVLGEQQGTEDLVRGSDFARKSVASYVRVATSDSVLDPVIAELGLAETGRELADDVEARAPKDTSMVAITVTKDDPMLAARIADAIGASLTRVVETQLEGANPDVGQAAVGPVRLTTVQPASPAAVSCCAATGCEPCRGAAGWPPPGHRDGGAASNARHAAPYRGRHRGNHGYARRRRDRLRQARETLAAHRAHAGIESPGGVF